MTQRWKAAGWLCMVLTVAFAIVALVLALRGATDIVTVPDVRIDLAPNPIVDPIVPQANGLLRSVVFGVLAGVAFFAGLACFFWSAVVEARGQRADIIRLLERETGQAGRSAPDGG